jgi:isocitrate dehydrogenase
MNDEARPEKAEQPTGADKNTPKYEALYDRFVEKTNELFEKGQEKSEGAWEKSMEIAREQMVVAGEFTTEQGAVFKQYLRRDLKHTRTDMQKLGVSAKEHLNPARLGAGALSTLSRLLYATGGALLNLSEKTEGVLLYKTGEVTMAGTLTCISCDHVMQFKQTTVVPDCPYCENTSFRKGY